MPTNSLFAEELDAKVVGRLREILGREEVFVDHPDLKFGDTSSTASLSYAKANQKEPGEVGREWAGKFDIEGVNVEVRRGILNFALTDEAILFNLKHLTEFPAAGRRAVVDYSSPNIAKPFSVGHLRSTVIGESVRRTLELLGWDVTGINFLGDWGTQFGKLLAAYSRWGGDLGEDPVKGLFKLYVRFHKEAENDPALKDEADEWFRRLEEEDKEAVALWERFREVSMEEFRRIYGLLGTSELVDAGESRFVKRGKELVGELLEKGVAEESEGAIVIPVGEDVPPLLLRKSDGTTIYATRDIASALWRNREFSPDLMLYVVGNDQKLHFRQLFRALGKMGLDAEMEHVNFGMVSLPEGKMSTRRGRVVFLEDVLDEAVARVKEIMAARGLDDPEDARRIGVGAVKFADLKNNRSRDVKFTWDMLSFEGDTGPYVQYSAVRSRRIGEKFGAGEPGLDAAFKELARKLVRFRHAVLEAARNRRPDILANYLLELCSTFNDLYSREQMGGNPHREWLAGRTYIALERGLWLLGIEVPQRM